jgi:hypothetical protein
MRVHRRSCQFRIFADGNADIFDVEDRQRVLWQKQYSVGVRIFGPASTIRLATVSVRTLGVMT